MLQPLLRNLKNYTENQIHILIWPQLHVLQLQIMVLLGKTNPSLTKITFSTCNLQYIARIINCLVELGSKFSHLRGQQNSSRAAHCKSNRFPISCIHRGAVDFLDHLSPTDKNHRTSIVTGALLSPTNLLEQLVYLPSTQSPGFWSEVHPKETSVSMVQPLPASP